MQEIISTDTDEIVGLIEFGADRGSCDGNSLCLEDGISILFAPGDFQGGDFWVFNSRAKSNTLEISIEWEIDSFWNLILREFIWSVVNTDIQLDFSLKNSDPAAITCENCEPVETYRFLSARVPEPAIVILWVLSDICG
jgi:hypothetical protein